MKKYCLNINQKVETFEIPRVMGIVNITPDSFFSSSRCQTEKEIIEKTNLHLISGADYIDVGAYSTRPNCAEVSEKEELERLDFALGVITKNFPNAIISVDTFRASVAEYVADKYGVAIINDISGGFDEAIFSVSARYNLCYVLMHIQGTPYTMHQKVDYQDLTQEIIKFFVSKLEKLEFYGVNNIILDPGFGFSKNLDQNYLLLKELDNFKILEKPLLVGVSRKSMIYKFLNISPEESLNGTTVLNALALIKGADILRVHDVKEAVETVKICKKSGLIG